MALPDVFLKKSVRPFAGEAGELAPDIGGAIPARVIPFTLQQQQQTQWCWSAVSVSISVHYRPSSSWTQCRLANQELSQTTCCSDGSSSICNEPRSLASALTHTSSLLQGPLTPLSFNDIKREIDAGRLVGCRVQWPDGSGHFVVISGYKDEQGVRWIEVRDPSDASRADYTFTSFLNQYRLTGTCTHSYLTS